ncbi:MAG: 23S rRNA (adenine(2503)-C(2))-methyltransferase RlmN [Terracidiphilus sp.]
MVLRQVRRALICSQQHRLSCSKLCPGNILPDKPDQLVPIDASAPAPRGLDPLSYPLFGLDAPALSEVLAQAGEPSWRADQIAEAMYRQYITGVSSITTLSLNLRRKLVSQGWQIGRPEIAKAFQSADGTERYLLHCPGPKPETVETVWMPEGDDGEAGDTSDEESSDPKSWRRATICVSSQVGCAVNCQFCLTAKLGLQRNLTAGEIAGQVVAVLDRHSVRVGRDRVNLVFMGMGEPFLNYDNFMAAVRLLVREVGLSPQRMTVSTSGIVPGIERFAQEPPDLRPKLAISLNAPNDQIRAEIMPIDRKWPIEKVIEAVRPIRLRAHERITFEYVLLGGVTDRPEHARELARLVRRAGLPVKVNLIAWNSGPGIAYSTPAPESVEAFRRLLAGEGIPAYVRQPRGRDIFAACGQLKRTIEA